MVYVPNNPPWSSSTALSSARLNNMETQYDEASTYLVSHTHDDLYPTKTEMESTYWYSGNTGSGSGSDADMLYHPSGNMHIDSFYGLGISTGIIILWYGSVASIPSGWALCDGTQGGPDLRGRFIVGAGNTYNPATTGGSSTFTVDGTITVDAHILTESEMGAHNHPFTDKYSNGFLYNRAYNGGSGREGMTARTGTTNATGGGAGHTHSAAEGTLLTGNAVASLPPYYALCYIQKIE